MNEKCCVCGYNTKEGMISSSCVQTVVVCEDCIKIIKEYKMGASKP